MGLAILIVLAILLALSAGLLINRFVRPFATSELQGIKLETLVSPVMTMTALLLAFVLVQTFSSYQRAKTGAAEEARKVDFLYELGGYVPKREGQDLQAATACYAKVIATLEWPVTGDGQVASEASAWTGQMRDVYGRLALLGGEQPYAAMVQADKERGEARSRRLTEARAAVPREMTVLLIVIASLGILALASLTLAKVTRNMQVVAVGTLALVLILVLLTINDLDRPFSGVIQLEPVDIERVAGDLGEDFAEDNPGARLPCDEAGRPLDAEQTS